MPAAELPESALKMHLHLIDRPKDELTKFSWFIISEDGLYHCDSCLDHVIQHKHYLREPYRMYTLLVVDWRSLGSPVQTMNHCPGFRFSPKHVAIIKALFSNVANPNSFPNQLHQPVLSVITMT
jgi:hypothetical protein